MSEAFLMNHGGVRFKSLRVPVLPDKTSYLYYNGTIYDTVDLTGAKIVADIGKSEVTLTPDNYSAVMTITSDTTAEWLIEATINGTTRHVVIPLVLYAPDPILNNNSWETIAKMSAESFAESFWSVGDTKTEVINGVSHSFRIIGFNHDDLNSADSRYDDSTYNNAYYDSVNHKRYAGITFQSVEAMGSSKMNNTDTNRGGWEECLMRTETIVDVYDSFPSDMKDVLRTVSKRTINGGVLLPANPETVITSADKVFLLAVSEVTTDSSDYRYARSSLPEQAVNSMYEAYMDNGIDGILSKSEEGEWLRSPHNMRMCSAANHFAHIRSDGTIQAAEDSSHATQIYEYYPAFCV